MKLIGGIAATPNAIGGRSTEISQRECGKERIYVDTKYDEASRRGGSKAKIIVERVYNGTLDMEEAFRNINEQNTVSNICAMMRDKMKCNGTDIA